MKIANRWQALEAVRWCPVNFSFWVHGHIPYPVRSPAPRLPAPAERGSKWAVVHLPFLSKTWPSFSAFTHPAGLPVCTLPKPLGGLQTRGFPEVLAVERAAERLRSCVWKRWRVLRTLSWGPEGNRALTSAGYWSPGVELHGCVVVVQK